MHHHQTFEFSTSEANQLGLAVRRDQPERQRIMTHRSTTLLLLLAATLLLGLSVALWHSRTHNIDTTDSQISDIGAQEQTAETLGKDDESLGATEVKPHSCNDLYTCQTDHPDRLGHNVALFAGKAICNAKYRFGVTQDGVLQWHNCDSNERNVVYDRKKHLQAQLEGGEDGTDAATTTMLQNAKEDLFFRMTETGSLHIVLQFSNGKIGHEEMVIWEKVPTLTITPTKKCLHNPLLDCPYLHLHKSGDVVLNSIDPNDGHWSDRKIQKCFDDLFHSE